MSKLLPIPGPTQGLGEHKWAYSRADMEAYAQANLDAQEPVMWRYRRWFRDDDSSDPYLSPWYTTNTDPRTEDYIKNLDLAPLAEVQPLLPGPIIKL